MSGHGRSIDERQTWVDVVSQVRRSFGHPALPKEGLPVHCFVALVWVGLVDVGKVLAFPLEDVGLAFGGPQTALVSGDVQPLSVGRNQDGCVFPQVGFVSLQVLPGDVLQSVDVVGSDVGSLAESHDHFSMGGILGPDLFFQMKTNQSGKEVAAVAVQ